MAAWMKPRSNSDPAADPRNAAKKLQAVRRIHARRWPPIEMAPMATVQRVVKGLLREYIDEHGFRSLIPKRKLPLTNAMIDAMFACYDGARRGSLVLILGSYYWVAMFALFATQSESGERKGEMTGPQGRNGITFGSLTYKIGAALYKVLTRALYASMQLGDGVYFAHGLAKNDPMGAYFAATPSFLPWRASGRCACRMLAELDLQAAIAPEARDNTPLFGPSPGAYFTGNQVDAAFTLLLAEGARVPEDELSNYSDHSFRIYLACALLAHGTPRWLIKRLLRWRGDAALELYARVSDQDWSSNLEGALRATVDASLVPRLPTMDFSPETEEGFLTMAHSLLHANLTNERVAA